LTEVYVEIEKCGSSSAVRWSGVAFVKRSQADVALAAQHEHYLVSVPVETT
jgi:hypothetical protein